MNADRFEAWLRDDLGPTLRQGSVVIMDNLSSHKNPRVKQIVESFGASLLYLPPYSPDLNPIEKAYSKLKAYLRKLAERSVSGLMTLLQRCADIFKPAEAANFFAACGYDTKISLTSIGRYLHISNLIKDVTGTCVLLKNKSSRFCFII